MATCWRCANQGETPACIFQLEPYRLYAAGIGHRAASGQALAAQGAFFHLFNHMLMKGLAFLAVGALMYALFLTSGVQGSHKALNISDLAGAAKSYPLAALALSIALLGLGGLPPLAGFMSKWQIFVAGFSTQNAWIMALVVFAALNSVLSLGYYAPLVNMMYREKAVQSDADRKTAAVRYAAFTGCAGVSGSSVGLFPRFDGLADRAGFTHVDRNVQPLG